MTAEFREGYEYFQKNAGPVVAAFAGGDFASERIQYVGSVEEEIAALEKAINGFFGDHTPAKQLKGDIAEFWHAGTFNINAATNESAHRAIVERSNEFASVDVSTSFGADYGLKYYATGQDSAKQQAASVFQRFKEYQAAEAKMLLISFCLTETMTVTPY